MRDTSWINHPAIKNIDAKKLAILVDLINETEGLPLEKSVPNLIKANAKLKSQGLSFTKEETELILELFTKDLPPSEKMKVQMMKQFITNQMSNQK